MKTEFHTLLFKAFHAQRKAIRYHMVEDYGLSPGQPKVLRYIVLHENCKLKDIAYETDVEPATVSRILNNLEHSGMLTRRIDQHNKRALQLCITPQGKAALEKWQLHCQEIEAVSLTGFTSKEQLLFKEYLARMYKNLKGKEII